MHLACTLVGDGPSDRSLVPIVEWALRNTTNIPFVVRFFSSADARSHDLSLKVARAVALYPCDILFIHRDAEHPDHYSSRMAEIGSVAANVSSLIVPIVPVRMTEAWLLVNESAIRRAANNPNGADPIDMPVLAKLDLVVDPKQVLFDLLRRASGLGARRIRSFNEGRARARVAELVDDFSALRGLDAFSEFERKTRQAVLQLSS